MNSVAKRAAIFLAALAAASAWAQTGKVEVLRDHVNLRAKPRAEAEVAGQVNKGTLLDFRGTNGEWIAVAPPDSIGLWVFTDFVKEGKVATDKLNVRAGAGINYPTVGAMVKGDPVVVRNKLGDWLEIAPPTNAALWVHQDFVELPVARAAVASAAAPEPVQPTAPPVSSSPVVAAVAKPPFIPSPVAPVASAQAPASAVPAAASAPVPPPDVSEQGLVPLAGQGEVMEREGLLHKTSLLDFARVSNYCLVDKERGRPVTTCYVRGNNAQLKQFEDRRIRIKGDGYWVKGGTKPVIVPRQIMPLGGE